MPQAQELRTQYRPAGEYDTHTLRLGMTVRLLPRKNGDAQRSLDELTDQVDALTGIVTDVNPKGFQVLVRKGRHGKPQQHIVLWGSDTALGGAFTVEVAVDQAFFR